MYFIGSDGNQTRILDDRKDDVRMINYGGSLTSLSRGYKNLKVLKASEGVLPDPCKICGDIVRTNYYNKLRDELIAGNICDRCHFWQEKVALAKSGSKKVARINGTHYIISPDDPRAAFQGFGGREFTILFHDGRKVVTHNLWYQGIIPDLFKDLLPDNAEFI